MKLEAVQADITSLDVDAVVNAANEGLTPGGGVCGAIHDAAGPELWLECRKVGRCPTGEARITGGYGLKAPWVIHAVGPVWHGGGRGEPGLLASAYRGSLRLADEKGLKSIAFPCISTGIFGYPAEAACQVAVSTVRSFSPAKTLELVVFACFGRRDVELYRRALSNPA